MTHTQAGIAMIAAACVALPMYAWQIRGYFNGRWDRLARKTER